MNKTILVTGGATGIGKGIIENLNNTNLNILLHYNTSEKSALIIKEKMINLGYNIEIFKADLSISSEASSLIQFGIKKFKSIDFVVNNSGISTSKLLTETTLEEWNTLLSVNLNSIFNICHDVLPYMINNKYGKIINISSIWGIVGASYEVAYSTTKAAVNGFTKALAKEVGPSNIQVNAIAPGIINTNMISDISQDDLNYIIEQIPLNRLGSITDIAKCVNWLLTDDYTTGQIISPNGGWVI